jgi:hypothetical protein
MPPNRPRRSFLSRAIHALAILLVPAKASRSATRSNSDVRRAEHRAPRALKMAQGSAGFPAWRRDKKVGELFEIPNTAWNIAGKSNWDAMYWNSPCISDDGRVIAAAVGGHASDKSLYGNNGVFQIDLRQDEFRTKRWTTLQAGNTTTAIPYDNSNGSSNTMIAWYRSKPYRVHYDAEVGGVPERPEDHSYYGRVWVSAAHCHDGKERVFCLSLAAPRQPIGGGRGYQVDAFRLGTDNDWDAPVSDDTPPPYPGSGTQWGDMLPYLGTKHWPVWSIASDPRDGKIYACNGRNFCRLDPMATSNHWMRLVTLKGDPGIWRGGNWLGWYGRGMVVDVVRDRIAYLTSTTNAVHAKPRIEYFSLATGSSLETIDLGGDLITHDRRINGHNGLTHDLDNDQYLVWLSPSPGQAADELYAVDPDDGTSTLLATWPQGFRGPMAGFRWLMSFGGVVIVPGRSSRAQAMPDLLFFPTRSSP